MQREGRERYRDEEREHAGSDNACAAKQSWR